MLWRTVHYPEKEVTISSWGEGRGDIVWPGCHHNFMLILNSQTHRAQRRDNGTKGACVQPFLLDPFLVALQVLKDHLDIKSLGF